MSFSWTHTHEQNPSLRFPNVCISDISVSSLRNSLRLFFHGEHLISSEQIELEKREFGRQIRHREDVSHVKRHLVPLSHCHNDQNAAVRVMNVSPHCSLNKFWNDAWAGVNESLLFLILILPLTLLLLQISRSDSDRSSLVLGRVNSRFVLYSLQSVTMTRDSDQTIEYMPNAEWTNDPPTAIRVGVKCQLPVMHWNEDVKSMRTMLIV